MDGDLMEANVDQLIDKLRNLQQEKTFLEQEIKGMKSASDMLQQELTSLQNDAYRLQGILKEKEELCNKLQFQCEEFEMNSSRLLRQNQESDELLQLYKCEIQELKLKHRKQRMKFENQLDQLMEQHKTLHSVFNPERLPVEIQNAESTKTQLLSAEQMKLAQLQQLTDVLEEMKNQEQAAPTTAEA